MPKKDNVDTTEYEQRLYQTRGFPLPSYIPFKTELENQKGKLKQGYGPFTAFANACDSFGLKREINYIIEGEELIIRVMATSPKEVLKILNDKNQKEAIKNALNIEYDKLAESDLRIAII
jgi:hypothetical protein